MKFVPVVCPLCGKTTQRPENAQMVHAGCPKKGRGPEPVYQEVKGEN